jgi:hypothetical protein
LLRVTFFQLKKNLELNEFYAKLSFFLCKMVEIQRKLSLVCEWTGTLWVQVNRNFLGRSFVKKVIWRTDFC